MISETLGAKAEGTKRATLEDARTGVKFPNEPIQEKEEVIHTSEPTLPKVEAPKEVVELERVDVAPKAKAKVKVEVQSKKIQPLVKRETKAKIEDVDASTQVENKKVLEKPKHKKDTTKVREFMNRGLEELENYTPEQKALLNTASDSLAYVRALVKPRKSGSTSSSSQAIIGYEFLVKEDQSIPVARYNRGARLYYDVEPTTWRTVHAGETIRPNLVETGSLLSQIKFGGMATGAVEDGTKAIEVRLGISVNDIYPQGKPFLQLLNQNVIPCIKDAVEPVAEKNESGKIQIKEGFEAYAPLFQRKPISKEELEARQKEKERKRELKRLRASREAQISSANQIQAAFRKLLLTTTTKQLHQESEAAESARLAKKKLEQERATAKKQNSMRKSDN